MNARAAVFSLLIGDETLMGEGDGQLGVEAVLTSGSVDTPTENFFIVIRWLETSPTFGQVGPTLCEIWVHERNTQDYGRIDDALARIKELMLTVVHRDGEDGVTMTVAEWNGDSRDLADEGYGTLTRNSTYTVVGRYTTT